MTPEFQTTIITFGTAIITGISTWLITKAKSKAELNKTDAEIREAFRTQLLEQINSLSKRLSEMESLCQKQALELIDLRAQNSRLQTLMEDQFNHIAIMQCYYNNIPRPAWLKDADGFMYYINDAYEREWNISKYKYEGNPDSFVWPEQYAKEFRANDYIVAKEKRGMHFVEKVPVDPSDLSKGDRTWDVYKFPVIYKEDFIGIGGIATPRD